MARQPTARRSARVGTNAFKPFVYKATLAFGALSLAAIGAGAAGGRAAFLLSPAAALIVFTGVVAIWRASRRARGADDLEDGAQTGVAPFRVWLDRDFDVEDTPVRGGEIASEIVLPVAAIAVGLTALTIVAALAAAEK